MGYKNQLSTTVRDFNDLKELNQFLKVFVADTKREFQAVQNSSIDSTQVRSAVSVSGGGGSASVSNLQAGSTAVGTSPTTITLSPSVTSYIVLYRCVNSLNEGVGCDITSIASGSFVATALATSTLSWAIFPI